jgi:hypothetical protein
MFLAAIFKFAVIFYVSSALCQLSQNGTHLNLTAIGAKNSESTLQCWSVGPFVTSSTPGTSGASSVFLGNTSNATYTVIPPRFDGGLHTAPAVQ